MEKDPDEPPMHHGTAGDARVQGETSSSSVLSTLLSPGYWGSTLSHIWTFRKQSLKPALLTSGLYLAFWAQVTGLMFTLGMGGDGPLNGDQVLLMVGVCLLVGLIAFVVSLVCLFSSFGLWLVVLTGFCRSFLLREDAKEHDKESVDLSDLDKQSVEFVVERKAYVTVVWLIYSAIIFVPFVWVLAAAIVALLSSDIGGGLTFLSKDFANFATYSSFPLLLLLTNYTLILFPLSSIPAGSAKDTAFAGVRWSLKTFPLLSLVSVILIFGVGPLYHVFDFPVVDILQSRSGTISDRGLVSLLLFLSALWKGLSLVVLLPLSVVVPSELLRAHFEKTGLLTSTVSEQPSSEDSSARVADIAGDSHPGNDFHDNRGDG